MLIDELHSVKGVAILMTEANNFSTVMVSELVYSCCLK